MTSSATFNQIIESPLGSILISAEDEGVTNVKFIDYNNSTNSNQNHHSSSTADQLLRYFAGQLSVFDLELHPCGTSFQQLVWKSLLLIPFGETISYRQQAERAGDLKKIRATASANGKNPIAIIIPCHRVIGSDGSLTGYASGLHRKRWLLQFEGAIPQLDMFNSIAE